jgi:hypothetical protein
VNSKVLFPLFLVILLSPVIQFTSKDCFYYGLLASTLITILSSEISN